MDGRDAVPHHVGQRADVWGVMLHNVVLFDAMRLAPVAVHTVVLSDVHLASPVDVRGEALVHAVLLDVVLETWRSSKTRGTTS